MKITKNLVKEIYKKMLPLEPEIRRASPFSPTKEYRELMVDGLKFRMWDDKLYPSCDNAPLLAKMEDGEIFYTFGEDFEI